MYYFNYFYVLGYFNGGFIWIFFLECYLKESLKVYIDWLMMIVLLYNMELISMIVKMSMFKEFYCYWIGLLELLIVYLIVGMENYISDGMVLYNSVNYGKYIF